MATNKQGQDADTELQEAGAGDDGSARRDQSGSARGEGSKAVQSDKKQKSKKKEEESAGLVGSIAETQQFLRGVAIEFSRISWPNRNQVIQETISVLFLVAVITLMVLGFDWFVGKFVFGPLSDWARHLGGGIGAG